MKLNKARRTKPNVNILIICLSVSLLFNIFLYLVGQTKTREVHNLKSNISIRDDKIEDCENMILIKDCEIENLKDKLSINENK